MINLGFLLAVTVLPYPLRIWCYHVGTAHEATASIVMATGLVLPGLFWMGKWFYALPDRRLMDQRLTDEFLAQLTRRYSIAVGVELLAIPLAALSPRAGVALSLGVVAFFLIPPPMPRYRDGQAPSASDVAGG